MEKIEGRIDSPEHLMTLLTEVRGIYDLYLKPPDNAKLRGISMNGTLAGCLKEVCRGQGRGGAMLTFPLPAGDRVPGFYLLHL